MLAQQPDLFGSSPQAVEAVDESVIAMVRARLHATLALVQGADRMPWNDMLSIIRADNGFRYDKNLLPLEEAAALWAAFDAEMDRLYAIMNEGRDPDETG